MVVAALCKHRYDELKPAPFLQYADTVMPQSHFSLSSYQENSHHPTHVLGLVAPVMVNLPLAVQMGFGKPSWVQWPWLGVWMLLGWGSRQLPSCQELYTTYMVHHLQRFITHRAFSQPGNITCMQLLEERCAKKFFGMKTACSDALQMDSDVKKPHKCSPAGHTPACTALGASA